VMIALLMVRSDAAPPKEGAAARPRADAGPLLSTFSEPWRLVSGPGEMRLVFLAMFTFSLGAGMFYALTPAFGKDTLGASPLAYGSMIGAMGAGAVLGASIMKRLRQRVQPRILITGTMLTFALFVAAVSRMSSVPAAMVLLVPAGVGWLGSFSSLQALVQIWAPNRLRARVVALYHMAHLAIWAVGSAAGGLLADRYGIRMAMTTGAAFCALAALSTWRLGLPQSFTGEVRKSLE
jgi:predicted MFS family arabinose efflux permease